MTIVGLDDRSDVQGGDPPVFNHGTAVNDSVARLLRGAEDDGGHRIVKRTRVAEGVKIEREEVGALAGFEGTNVTAAEDAGTAEGGDF